MDQEDEFLWFASLEMDGTQEQRQSLPKKNKKEGVKSFKLGGFVQNLQENYEVEGTITDFVPYAHPLPDYDTMNEPQKQWYFYWRSQIRQGIYLDTAPDYVYVLAYEYIHKVGEMSPDAAYQNLLNLHKNYSHTNPRLQTHLEEWILDFCILHPLSPTDFLKVVDVHTLDDSTINLIFYKYNQIFPLFLPSPLLSLHYEEKQVFQQLEQYQLKEVVEDILEKTFEFADTYCYETKNKRLLQLYGTEKKEVCSRFCYQSANFLAKKPFLDLTLQNHSKFQKVFLFLGFFLNFTLHSISSLWNLPLSVTDSPLGAGLEEKITHFLKEHFPVAPADIQLSLLDLPPVSQPKDYSHIRLEDTIEKLEQSRRIAKEKRMEKREKQSKLPKNGVKLQLDFSQISQLREASDAVRQALEVPEETPLDLSAYYPIKPVENPENRTKSPTFSLDLTAIDSLRKDSDQVRQALAVDVGEFDVNVISKLEETVIPPVLPNLVSGEYQLEILLESSEKTSQTQETDVFHTDDQRIASHDLEPLPPPLKEFYQLLTPHNLTTLTLIAQEKWEELDFFAMEQFSMTELLVDEINGIAMEELGDILLETTGGHPIFLEEYRVLMDIFQQKE